MSQGCASQVDLFSTERDFFKTVVDKKSVLSAIFFADGDNVIAFLKELFDEEGLVQKKILNGLNVHYAITISHQRYLQPIKKLVELNLPNSISYLRSKTLNKDA